MQCFPFTTEFLTYEIIILVPLITFENEMKNRQIYLLYLHKTFHVMCVKQLIPHLTLVFLRYLS